MDGFKLVIIRLCVCSVANHVIPIVQKMFGGIVLFSVVDPDPHGFTLILVGWIRIGNTHPDPGRPKRPTEVEKESSSFEVLDVLI
jgi:hypothetical protein